MYYLYNISDGSLLQYYRVGRGMAQVEEVHQVIMGSE